MLSSTLRPLTRRFPFPQRATNHHDYPRQVNPMRRIEDHLAVKSGLDGVQIVEQACMVVPPTRYPVVHRLPIVRADIHHGHGDHWPVLVAPSTRFRRSRTDRTRAFEVVCFLEEFLTRVRYRARLQDLLEVGNCDLFAFRNGSQRPDLARKGVFIPSEYRVGATANIRFVDYSTAKRAKAPHL
jgi:hypothetical protein